MGLPDQIKAHIMAQDAAQRKEELTRITCALVSCGRWSELRNRKRRDEAAESLLDEAEALADALDKRASAVD